MSLTTTALNDGMKGKEETKRNTDTKNTDIINLMQDKEEKNAREGKNAKGRREKVKKQKIAYAIKPLPYFQFNNTINNKLLITKRIIIREKGGGN